MSNLCKTERPYPSSGGVVMKEGQFASRTREEIFSASRPSRLDEQTIDLPMKFDPLAKLIQRIYKGVKHIARVENLTPCWEWKKAVTKDGYGSISIDGKTYRTHRVVYELFKGRLGALHVLHACDNRLCCNPDHLSGGTRSENMQDAAAKGRLAQQVRASGRAGVVVGDVLRAPDAGDTGESDRPDMSGASAGEANANSRFTEKDIRRIRNLHKQMIPLTKIALEYGTQASTIHDIVNRRRWAHIK